ncbi:DUF732 domain-containing protein [Microbacterium sp.]|uniref:DUF732 domain-containing protein n=1 Tax=Microbacterium sp. TaxID=51671 RepID=UPI002811079F|nr:hypothetical protein [Microbacterium sp.]
MKTRIAAIVAAAVLVVGGGTAYALTTSGQEPAPVETTATSSPTPSDAPSSEPLVAETPSPSAEEDAEAIAEEKYLIEARSRLAGLGAATTIPDATDEQLLVAGGQACEALAAGTEIDDVSVVEGEERVQGSYLDSASLARAAVLFLCPDLLGK